MIVTDATKAHAQKIVDYINEHPLEHSQKFWVGSDFYSRVLVNEDVTPETGCGTTMCIAGTSVFLTEGVTGLKETHWTDFVTKGRSNLGLNFEEAHALFYTMDESTAYDAVLAIAAGDEDKFREILHIG